MKYKSINLSTLSDGHYKDQLYFTISKVLNFPEHIKILKIKQLSVFDGPDKNEIISSGLFWFFWCSLLSYPGEFAPQYPLSYLVDNYKVTRNTDYNICSGVWNCIYLFDYSIEIIITLRVTSQKSRAFQKKKPRQFFH